MDIQQLLNGLQLDNDTVLHQQVNNQWITHLLSFIDDRDLNLMGDVETTHPQFCHKAFFIDGLQQAWPQDFMDFKGCTNDCMGQFVVLVNGFCFHNS